MPACIITDNKNILKSEKCKQLYSPFFKEKLGDLNILGKNNNMAL